MKTDILVDFILADQKLNAINEFKRLINTKIDARIEVKKPEMAARLFGESVEDIEKQKTLREEAKTRVIEKWKSTTEGHPDFEKHQNYLKVMAV